MFKRLVKLQWTAFSRSAAFDKSLVIKVFLALMTVYLLGNMVLLGSYLYPILRRTVPNQSPLWVLSQFLGYWVFFELLLRYFLQKLPVIDIKPLLINNIPKSNIINYILVKSVFSGFNLLALSIFTPFATVLLAKGYPLLNTLLWCLAIFILTLCINYLVFIINKSSLAFSLIVGALIVLWGLDYLSLIEVTQVFGPIFHAFYAYPIAILIPILLLVFLYIFNYRVLSGKRYLDDALKSVASKAKTSDMVWTKRFGAMASFLKLDLKLIWRNKRTKTQVWVSLMIVFYGLILYNNPAYRDVLGMQVFMGVFMTGFFLANFGQFIPAWDSAYYSMLMSQNILLRKYLEAKALLISVSVVVMFLLTIPYVYFGWKVLAINTACAIYNFGINVPLILYFGSFNKKRIELDQGVFMNSQGASAVQFLLMIPILGLPIALFLLLNWLVYFNITILIISALGVFGYLMKNKILIGITRQYKKKKYVMVAGFKQQNA
ncbi:MAG: DUF5687 family protein [Bacteroidota bacterium]